MDVIVEVVRRLIWLQWMLAPVIVAVVAIVVWLRVMWPVGGWLTRAGQPRLGSYYYGAMADVGWAGALLIFLLLEERKTGEPHLERFLTNIWLMPDIGVDQILVASLILLVVMYAIGAASGWISGYFQEQSSEIVLSMEPQTVAERFIWVTVVSPQAGFFEEIAYRGIWLSILLGWGADAVIAVAISSLMFGLAHTPYGLVWTIGSTVFGAVAAISVLVCESLWPAIIAHTIYDMTVSYVFGGATEEVAGDDQPSPARYRRRLLPLNRAR